MIDKMTKLKPFFSYYGSKYRISKYYPEPKLDRILEPFCGSAGYSLHYPWKEVILSDSYDAVFRTWDYLIRVTQSEIMSLETDFDHIDELNCCEEAKLLIGWWLNKGSAVPCKQPSKWMRSKINNTFWGDSIKKRIARQLPYIRHWRVFHSKYSECENVAATWFIDPPYQRAGVFYKESSKRIDYDDLSRFCLSRKGQVIVCENMGADWLEFEYFRRIQSSPKRYESQFSKSRTHSDEAIFYLEDSVLGCRSDWSPQLALFGGP